MAYDISDDFRRPLPLALAAVAILGWLLVAYYSMQVASVQGEMHDAQNRAEKARESMAADLQNLKKASGDLAVVQKQAEDAKAALSEATAARAASQNELADLTKQITDARLTVSGAQEEASARTRDLQAADTQAKAAAGQLATIQTQLAAAQSQLDAAANERDKTLGATASARSQFGGSAAAVRRRRQDTRRAPATNRRSGQGARQYAGAIGGRREEPRRPASQGSSGAADVGRVEAAVTRTRNFIRSAGEGDQTAAARRRQAIGSPRDCAQSSRRFGAGRVSAPPGDSEERP